MQPVHFFFSLHHNQQNHQKPKGKHLGIVRKERAQTSKDYK